MGTSEKYQGADPEISVALTLIFSEWEEHFTNKLKDAKTVFPRNTVLSWTIALQKLGMTPLEILIARESSLCGEWYPTSAGSFFKLAQQEILKQYPEIRLAYLKAVNNDYSLHEVTYETARRVGFYFLKSQDERYSWKRWQELYPVVCREHFLGAQFVLPVEDKRQENTKPPAHSEVAEEHMNKIRDLLKKSLEKEDAEKKKSYSTKPHNQEGSGDFKDFGILPA